MDVQKLPLLTFAHFVELWCFRQPFSLNFCEEEGKTTVVRVFCRKKERCGKGSPGGTLYKALYGDAPLGYLSQVFEMVGISLVEMFERA